MDFLSLAKEAGLLPKRTASTNSGEYKSACPKCKEGNDRFCIWPNEGKNGKYWCRRCHCNGDAIQFCRDFLGLSYQQACNKLNINPQEYSVSVKKVSPFRIRKFTPSAAACISESWQTRAIGFVQDCHKQLLANQQGLFLLYERGLTTDTIIKFQLGWSVKETFDSRVSWGLSSELRDDGKERKQWLPKGIIIPSFENGIPARIKVRRAEWHLEDTFPKYVEISGGMRRPSIYGDQAKPIVIVESELDAILIQQFASDLCCCLSLGGVSKRPDKHTHEFLSQASLILLSLDYDESGKKEYPFWMSLYPNLRPWPAGKGKSPGDSLQLGVDLRHWIESGLSNSK